MKVTVKTLGIIICIILIGIILYFTWLKVRPNKTQNISGTSLVIETPLPQNILQVKSALLTNDKQLYPVAKVVDGDTVDVRIGGKNEPVRLIGMDSPELYDPRKPVQCFAKEAQREAGILLTGKQVQLETDPTQGDRDKYNRLLRYVFLSDGTNFSEFMIAGGFAHEYTYMNNPYKYQAQFQQAEKSARDNKRGLWADGVCITQTPIPVK